jgi:uncharacterized small protein (DUF1192 family)
LGYSRQVCALKIDAFLLFSSNGINHCTKAASTSDQATALENTALFQHLSHSFRSDDQMSETLEMDDQMSTYPPPPSTPSTPSPQNVVLSFISGTTIENTPTRLLEIGAGLAVEGVGEVSLESSALIDPVLKELNNAEVSGGFSSSGGGSRIGDDEDDEFREMGRLNPDKSALGTGMPSSPPVRRYARDALDDNMLSEEVVEVSIQSAPKEDGLGVDVSMCESGIDARELPSSLERDLAIPVYNEDTSSPQRTVGREFQENNAGVLSEDDLSTNEDEDDTQETLEVGSSLLRENEELSIIVLGFEDNPEVVDVVVFPNGDSARGGKRDVPSELGSSDDFLRDTGDDKSHKGGSVDLPSSGTSLGLDTRAAEPATMERLPEEHAQQLLKFDFKDSTADEHRLGPDVPVSCGSRSTTDDVSNYEFSELPKLKSDDEQAHSIQTHPSRIEIPDSETSEINDHNEGDQLSGKAKVVVADLDDTSDAVLVDKDAIPELLRDGHGTNQSSVLNNGRIEDEPVVIMESDLEVSKKVSDDEAEIDDRIADTIPPSERSNEAKHPDKNDKADHSRSSDTTNNEISPEAIIEVPRTDESVVDTIQPASAVEPLDSESEIGSTNDASSLVKAPDTLNGKKTSELAAGSKEIPNTESDESSLRLSRVEESMRLDVPQEDDAGGKSVKRLEEAELSDTDAQFIAHPISSSSIHEHHPKHGSQDNGFPIPKAVKDHVVTGRFILKEIPDSTEIPSSLDQPSNSGGVAHEENVSNKNALPQSVTTPHKSAHVDTNLNTVEFPGSSPAPPSSSSSSLQQPSTVVDIPPTAPRSPVASRKRSPLPTNDHTSSPSKNDAKSASPTKSNHTLETPPPKKKQKTRSEILSMDESDVVTEESTTVKSKDDILMDELKAMKVASIQARNATLEAEIARVRNRLGDVTEGLEYVPPPSYLFSPYYVNFSYNNFLNCVLTRRIDIQQQKPSKRISIFCINIMISGILDRA